MRGMHVGSCGGGGCAGSRREMKLAGAKRALAAVTCILVASLFGGGLAAPSKKPNIIAILVDDLGYNDLSIQGSPDVKSPNIDDLMRDGVRFNRAYSVAGFCSPARVGFLAGIHPFHTGHRLNPAHDIEDSQAGMPLDLTILPETLKKRGYNTIAIGKWHLGFHMFLHPMHRGFDHFFGFLGGRFNYFEDRTWYGKGSIWEYLYDDWKLFKKVSYLTVDWTTAAIKYINRNKKKPFFIYLSYNAQHGPFEYLEKDVDPSVSEERRPHVAMIKTLDDQIGRLRKHVRRLGLEEDTIFLFTNDNGGHFRGANNYPLREFKHSLYEGGLRVPFSLTWKGRIKPNQQSEELVSLIDVYPTFQAVANVPRKHANPKLQGVDLLQYVKLVGEGAPARSPPLRKHLVNRDNYGVAVVYDLIFKLWLDNNKPIAMYNLQKDVGESKNILGKQRSRANALKKVYKSWNKATKKEAFGEEYDPNPLTVKCRTCPKSFKSGTKVEFVAQGSSTGNSRINFQWEVFKPGDTIYADFNNVKAPSLVKIQRRTSRKTYMTFRAKGKWIVRINVNDGRFWKWTDTQVNIK